MSFAIPLDQMLGDLGYSIGADYASPTPDAGEASAAEPDPRFEIVGEEAGYVCLRQRSTGHRKWILRIRYNANETDLREVFYDADPTFSPV